MSDAPWTEAQPSMRATEATALTGASSPQQPLCRLPDDLVGLPDDPEHAFRRLPHALRRWTPSAVWRRIRLPLRRRRWLAENRAATAAWTKADRAAPRESGAASGGHAVALGDFSGDNGISRAALYELPRLRAAHPGLEIVDAADALRGASAAAAEGPRVDRLYLLSAPDTYGRALPCLAPDRIAGAWRTGLWVWETPILGPDWDFGFDIVHEIWTPSAHSMAAIAPPAAARGIPVRLRPHAVAAPEPRPAPDGAKAQAARHALGIGEDAFLGLAAMDIRSCPARKNPWAHVAAWIAAFGAETVEDARAHILILKIRVSKRTRIVLDELAAMIAAGSTGTGAPTVRLVPEHLPDTVMAGLQAGADVHLALSRAEGYGLTIAEALALGRPVLATAWSAPAEYGPGQPGFHAVPWRPVPCRDWTGHFADTRFTWAEPDIAAAAAILRRLAGDRDARHA